MRQGSAGTVDVTARPGIGRLPTEGSELRRHYDRFVANPGKPLPFVTSRTNGGFNVLNQLQNFYGLVIHKTTNKGERVLVGRHLGAKYEKYEVTTDGKKD